MGWMAVGIGALRASANVLTGEFTESDSEAFFLLVAWLLLLFFALLFVFLLFGSSASSAPPALIAFFLARASSTQFDFALPLDAGRLLVHSLDFASPAI